MVKKSETKVRDEDKNQRPDHIGPGGHGEAFDFIPNVNMKNAIETIPSKDFALGKSTPSR